MNLNKKIRILLSCCNFIFSILDEAMRFHVFRYLSKPLDKQRIFRNLQDAITLYNTSITKVSIETKDGMFVVLSTDIFFIEAHNHKTIVHTSEGDYLSVHNINYWLNKLHIPCFFQSHRSFIVNLDHVSSFDRSADLFMQQSISCLSDSKKIHTIQRGVFTLSGK